MGLLICCVLLIVSLRKSGEKVVQAEEIGVDYFEEKEGFSEYSHKI